MPTTTTPWTQQTRDALAEQARGYGLPDTGTRKVLYQRILNHLRDQHRAELGVEPVTAIEPEVVEGDDEDDDDVDDDIETVVSATDAAMELWHAEGVVEPVSTLPAMSRWTQMEAMAKVLCRSELMPRHIQKARDPEADCMVILLTAHDLGLSSTLALRKVAVIEGQPALGADLMRILGQRDGHDFKINVFYDDTDYPIAAEVLIHRSEWRDDDWRGARFTLENAMDAGLCSVVDGRARARTSSGKKLPWELYTEDMLVARATSRACRRYLSDSLGGVSYTPEELGSIDVEEVYEDEASPPAAPEPRPLTEAELTIFRDQIGGLDDEQRAWAREQWKARGIPPLSATPTRLDERHLPIIGGLIAEAANLPTDAEVVEDDAPTGVLTTARSVGTATADPTLLPEEVDPARQYARDRTARVKELAEELATTDAALDESKEARASRARLILEQARAKAEGQGLVEPLGEGGLCPDCHKPMSEDNPKCMSHPL